MRPGSNAPSTSTTSRVSCVGLTAWLLSLALSMSARSDIIGINNLNGWCYNQADSAAPADLPDSNTIRLTNLNTSEARSIFFTAPQSITQFTAKFTYRAANASVFGCDYGATITFQNAPEGCNALGGTGSGLGYSGIPNSAAISLQLQSNTSGFYTGGVVAGGSSVAPVVLISGHPIDVTLSYDGTLLSLTLLDRVTLDFHSRIFPANIPNVVQSSEAFIGFTGSTTTGQCSGNAADQYFSTAQFFESYPCAPVGDIDQDGDVDQADLGALLSAYGTCPGDPLYISAAGLLAGDPCVTQADLGVVLSNYSLACPE